MLVGVATALLVVYVLLYFKFIYSVVDPLFVFVFTTAFASVLAIQIIPDLSDILHFFGCQLALWFGFVVAYTRINKLDCIGISKQSYLFRDQSLLRWITYILLAAYIFSNLIIGYVKGFALLSDAPTEAKIANFQQGFGLFRKINWSTGTFTSTSLIFLYLLQRKKIDFILLLVITFFTVLEGSKSALLQIIISAGIVFYHPAFADQQTILRRFQRYIPVLLVGVMGVFVGVLLKENEGYEGAFFALIRRLLYSADSVLYYYQPANITFFENYSFGDYLARIANPILGFFRIQPYIEAPGNLMVDNLRAPGSVAGVTVGPNAPFYIEGRIYFTFWAAFPYSFLVGYAYARLRVYYFSLTQSTAFYFVYMGAFIHLASSIIIDTNLAITQLFDLTFFVLVPYVFISLVLTKKLKIRLSKKLANAFVHS